MIHDDLVSHLRADAGVAALAAERIYPLVIPEHAYNESTKLPCLVYSRTSATRQPLFCDLDGIVASGFRVDSYARTYGGSLELAASVRTALADFSGAMGASQVSKVLIESEFELVDIEPGLYRVSQQYTIWHDE